MLRRSLPFLLLGAQALVLTRAPARRTSCSAYPLRAAADGDGDDGAEPSSVFARLAERAAQSNPAQPSARAVRSKSDGARSRQEAYKRACDEAEAGGEPAPNYVAFMSALSAAEAPPPVESAAPPAAATSADEERELADRKRTEDAKDRALTRMEAATQNGGYIPSSFAADEYMSGLEAP